MQSVFCKNSEILEAVRSLDPANNSKYQTDDAGNGRLFSDVFGSVCRFCQTTGEFSFYDGVRWRPDERNMRAEQLAKRLARALYIYSADADPKYQKFVIRLGNRREREIMLRDARDFQYFSENDLDRDNDLLNLQNGTLNLRNGEFHNHNPDDLISKVCNAEYRPGARSEDWEQFLTQIMMKDADKIHYLQRITGYGLLGECNEDEFYLLYGSTTRNGKTTYLSTIGYVMGDYASMLNPDALAQRQRSNANDENIADLRGIRFVHVEEPSKQMILDTALVKNLTGRAVLKVSRKYEHQLQFLPVFKIYIASNFLPTVTDDSLFASDRVKVISFDRHFEPDEQDKGLKKRLQSKDNAAGILNWMLDGLQSYFTEGTTPPDAVRQTTEQYRNDSDKLGLFIKECLTKSTGAVISVKNLYQKYSEWCEAYGYHVENRKNFSQGLNRKNLLSATGTINGQTIHNVVKGYDFVDDLRGDIGRNPFES